MFITAAVRPDGADAKELNPSGLSIPASAQLARLFFVLCFCGEEHYSTITLDCSVNPNSLVGPDFVRIEFVIDAHAHDMVRDTGIEVDPNGAPRSTLFPFRNSREGDQ